MAVSFRSVRLMLHDLGPGGRAKIRALGRDYEQRVLCVTSQWGLLSKALERRANAILAGSFSSLQIAIAGCDPARDAARFI